MCQDREGRAQQQNRAPELVNYCKWVGGNVLASTGHQFDLMFAHGICNVGWLFHPLTAVQTLLHSISCGPIGLVFNSIKQTACSPPIRVQPLGASDVSRCHLQGALSGYTAKWNILTLINQLAAVCLKLRVGACTLGALYSPSETTAVKPTAQPESAELGTFPGYPPTWLDQIR